MGGKTHTRTHWDSYDNSKKKLSSSPVQLTHLQKKWPSEQFIAKQMLAQLLLCTPTPPQSAVQGVVVVVVGGALWLWMAPIWPQLMGVIVGIVHFVSDPGDVGES